jgi:hypothetical protein
MQSAPAIIVHSLADAQAALAPGLPVTLLSAPGAARYAGCLWWSELLRAAGFTGEALLDCGDSPGRAVEALKLGLRGIVLTCEPAVFAAVAGIAVELGATLLPAAPTALDLAEKNAARRIWAWLTNDRAGH